MSSSMLPTPNFGEPSESTFWFGDLPVRAKTINGEPWFVAADVCTALGIRTVDGLSGLDADEKTSDTINQPGISDIVVHLISESGLYSLILRSRRAEAKAFKRWVTHEVLPSIRKTGQYDKPQTLSRRELAQMVIEAEDRAAAYALERDAAWQTIERDAPKVGYVKSFVDPAADTCKIGDLARQLGIGQNGLFEYLRERKRIFKDANGMHQPYADWLTWFTTRSQHEVRHRLHNGQVPTTLYVTPVGKEGIRRMIERDPGDLYG